MPHIEKTKNKKQKHSEPTYASKMKSQIDNDEAISRM